MLNPPIYGKIQGLFKPFEYFSSAFQGKFNFQGLLKTVLYIHVLFKPVQTLSSQRDIFFEHSQQNVKIYLEKYSKFYDPDF